MTTVDRTTRRAPAAAGTVDARRVLEALRHLLHAIHSSSKATERRQGISAAQLFVLRQLGEEEPLDITALAARTFTHQSSVSTVVHRLADRGLVRRIVGRNDGRRREISLTAAGRRVVSRAGPPAQVQLVDGLRRLSPSRLAALADDMELWLRNAGLGRGAAPLTLEGPRGDSRDQWRAAARGVRSG